jgi:hypothetical protein
MSKWTGMAAIVIAAVIGFCGDASATTVVVGTGADTNCYPFVCYFGSEYQQVYSATAFSTSIPINGLVFYETRPSIPEVGSFTISLSYTSMAVNGLSTNLATNIGTGSTTVFSGSLPATAHGKLVLPLSTTFTYDPTLGNLLLTAYVTGNPSNLAWTGSFDGDSNGVISRAYNLSSGDTFADYRGLITGFVTTPSATVPLPGGLPLFTTGLGVLGLLGWRRRAAATSA